MNLDQSGSIILAAAKEFLAPIGFKRNGSSRLWYSDERFWLVVVEFQPSSWSKGSYLNVGVEWLWNPKDHFSFDSGRRRLEELVKFQSDEQFKVDMSRFAHKAAQEADRIRRQFCNMLAISHQLRAEAVNGSQWNLYHAAIASGLAGELIEAKQLFSDLNRVENPLDWQRELITRASHLASFLEDLNSFQSVISNLVQTGRSVKRLEPQTICF